MMTVAMISAVVTRKLTRESDQPAAHRGTPSPPSQAGTRDEDRRKHEFEGESLQLQAPLSYVSDTSVRKASSKQTLHIELACRLWHR
jgi:hypothetical protein